MDVEATKKRLEELVEEINLLSSKKIRFHQQAKVKRNMAIKGANGTLYIQQRQLLTIFVCMARPLLFLRIKQKIDQSAEKSECCEHKPQTMPNQFARLSAY